MASLSYKVVCVPTSYQTKWLLKEKTSLPVSDLDTHSELDVIIDGADEVDPNLNLIKVKRGVALFGGEGCVMTFSQSKKGGGGCQTQEKIVASCAKTMVVVGDARKQSQVLGSVWRKGVPIEVVPIAVRPVERALRKLGGKPVVRESAGKAGPVVTDNGGFIIDCDFGDITHPADLHARIRSIVGVVETGLFIDMASVAYFGQDDGSVVRWEKPSSKK